MMSLLVLSRIPRNHLLWRRLVVGAQRNMSAHVWYRASLLESSEIVSTTSASESTLATTNNGMSFVDAPETAFGSIALHNMVKDEQEDETSWASSFLPSAWDQEVTMVDSPETAFGGIALNEVMQDVSTQEIHHVSTQIWSNTISFSSPESDFSAYNTTTHDSTLLQSMNTLDQDVIMVDSPETALGGIALHEVVVNDDSTKQTHTSVIHEMVGPFEETMFAVTQPETAFGDVALGEYVKDTTMLSSQQDATIPPLPTSLLDYYETCGKDSRAMVVTCIQNPFYIVDVNDAWIGLCGYTRGESVNHSLGELLHGKDTNAHDLDDFLTKLYEGNEATAVVVNYTESGRKFRNKVHAGPLKNEDDVITHFVGVLQEVKEMNA